MVNLKDGTDAIKHLWCQINLKQMQNNSVEIKCIEGIHCKTIRTPVHLNKLSSLPDAEKVSS